MTIPNEYICPNNKKLIFRAVTHGCGQSFERDIMNELLAERAKQNCEVLCPSCNEKILTNSLIRNTALEEKILTYISHRKAMDIHRPSLIHMMSLYRSLRVAKIEGAIAKAASIAANLRVSLYAKMDRIQLDREYFYSDADFELANMNRYELDHARIENIVINLRKCIKRILIHFVNNEMDLKVNQITRDYIKSSIFTANSIMKGMLLHRASIERAETLVAQKYSEFKCCYDRFRKLNSSDATSNILCELRDVIKDSHKATARANILTLSYYEGYKLSNS